MMSFIAGLAGALPLAAMAGMASAYTRIRRQRTRVECARRDIEAELRRRCDLVPAVLDSVGRSAGEEQHMVQEVAQARVRVTSADDDHRMAAERALGGALIGLLAATDVRAEMQDCPRFASLQDELTRAETRIAHARQRYNDAVHAYNRMLRRLPARLRTRPVHLPSYDLLDADPLESRLQHRHP
jgi:LemA protein